MHCSKWLIHICMVNVAACRDITNDLSHESLSMHVVITADGGPSDGDPSDGDPSGGGPETARKS